MKKVAWLELIALNAAMFMLQIASGGTLTNLLAFVPATALQHPWTILTSLFLHANPMHLLFNMWALFVFGPLLEKTVGRNKFLAIYFISGIVGNVGFALFYPPATAGIGASGAIYGIIGALAMILPNLVVLVFFLPLPLWMAAIGWALLEFFSSFSPSPIANLVHLTGLFAGALWGLKLRNEISSEWQYYK